jgi:succinate-acetate transporter protein
MFFEKKISYLALSPVIFMIYTKATLKRSREECFWFIFLIVDFTILIVVETSENLRRIR